jgi:hypothetical protein
MKKIVTSLMTLLCSMQLASAQKINASSSPEALHDFYVQKYKTKTMVGLALLVGGVVMANEEHKINVSQPIHSSPAGSNPNGYIKNKKLWLFYYGRVMTLASIPFFISSGANKERARLALKEKNISK